MTSLDNRKIKLERSAEKATKWIGSTTSLIVHTILFTIAFVLPFFGIGFDRVLLVLTTVVSLEAIYLSIFIQMSVNKNTQDIEVIQEDVEEIQEDVDEIQKDVDEIQEDVDEIQEDVDEIQEDIEEIEEEHEKDYKEDRKMEKKEVETLSAIQATLAELHREIEQLKTKK